MAVLLPDDVRLRPILQELGGVRPRRLDFLRLQRSFEARPVPTAERCARRVDLLAEGSDLERRAPARADGVVREDELTEPVVVPGRAGAYRRAPERIRLRGGVRVQHR